MAFKNLIEWLSLPLSANAENYHRQLLLFQTAHTEKTLTELTETLPATLSCAVISHEVRDYAHAGIHQFAISDYKKVLGQEFDIGIYDAFSGFRPSALLALAGTLRFSGRLIIVCPPLKKWPSHSSVAKPHYLSHGYFINESLFIRHITEKFIGHSAVSTNDHENDEQVLPFRHVSDAQNHTLGHGKQLTDSQDYAMREVLHSVDTDMPLTVITAPRGRGKSALLGTIAAALLNKTYKLLLVSARHHSQNVFYRHLASTLSCSSEEAKACIQWTAPDNPVAYDNDADILLIDEAASLPLPVLIALTQKNKKCLLTTTTLGFEGSGLGFLHKFLLPRKAKGELRHLTLKEPVRWASDDPLEAVLDEALLFSNSNLFPEKNNKPLTISHVTATQLDSTVLARLYHLLSDSHYQTSPDDLMRLTDAPDVSFILAYQNGLLVGAVVLNHEGGERLSDLSDSIARGSRRVKGHLSAQSLALMTVDPSLACDAYWRINRIAVHEEYRRKGIATSMLEFIREDAIKNNIDWLTSSYASASDVDNFWQQSGFTLVREGKKPDKASGQISKLVLKPISQRAKGKRQFLIDVFFFDSAESSEEIYRVAQTFEANSLITARLRAYLNGHRSRELTGNAFTYLVLNNASLLSEDGIAFNYIVNRKSPEEIIILHHLTGKKEFEKRLFEEAQLLYTDS
ncbi:tRNA(Met) cytidine acetyltransferase [Salinimonas sp. HHU 13199]|uniref:tRNA(Met) cytidine acetyltransferase n=1 Tax=Salinimonas profundi TaxID=2729140 RepID=A0ABR8LJ44_9ALTE|nr:GNAT family N-acetyltransferase [Salinimonas profundi]MBD3585253.1 tRNA(Met) cytidine acetyltransferase [Salinimonas profundi]